MAKKISFSLLFLFLSIKGDSSKWSDNYYFNVKIEPTNKLYYSSRLSILAEELLEHHINLGISKNELYQYIYYKKLQHGIGYYPLFLEVKDINNNLDLILKESLYQKIKTYNLPVVYGFKVKGGKLSIIGLPYFAQISPIPVYIDQFTQLEVCVVPIEEVNNFSKVMLYLEIPEDELYEKVLVKNNGRLCQILDFNRTGKYILEFVRYHEEVPSIFFIAPVYVKREPSELLHIVSCPEKGRKVAQEKRFVFNMINQLRQKKGLNLLRWHPALEKVAEEQSHLLSQFPFLTHLRGKLSSAYKLIKMDLWFSIVGENLAKVGCGAQAVELWINSPLHKATFLNKLFYYTGIGIEQTEAGDLIFTQLFAGKEL